MTTSPVLSVGRIRVEDEDKKPMKLLMHILRPVWIALPLEREFTPVILVSVAFVGGVSDHITELLTQSPASPFVRDLLLWSV